MSKRSAFVVLAVFLLAVAAACTSPSSGREATGDWLYAEGKIKVLCTTQMIQDIVSQVGGDRVATVALITGQLDPHTYELVKGDDEKIAAADLIVYNGLGLEHGPSLHHHLADNPIALGVGDVVMDEEPDRILTIDEQLDPHIWLDISLWAQTIDPVVERLVRLDPQGREEYMQRGQELKARLLEEDRAVFSLLQAIPEKRRYLVTSHDAFNYFTRAYMAEPSERNTTEWKKRFAAPEGLAPEGQLSSADIHNIIEHMARYDIRVLFAESNVSKDSIRKIVQAGKSRGMEFVIAGEPLYADAMGPEGTLGGTYSGMVRYNAQTIADHLLARDSH